MELNWLVTTTNNESNFWNTKFETTPQSREIPLPGYLVTIHSSKYICIYFLTIQFVE